MTVDEGRARALRTFGVDGVRVRELAPTIVRQCHESMAVAQLEADMPHTGPYGYIWRKCLYEFRRVLGQLPTAEPVVVPRAGYSLVSFGGVVIFPWRYGRDASTPSTTRTFAVSDARVSIFTTHRGFHPQLDLTFEHPELSEDERQLLAEEDELLTKVMQSHPRVVVVAYASNPSALHDIHWGEATLGRDGLLTFSWNESLLSAPNGALVDLVAQGESFSEGPIPRPSLGAKDAELEAE